MVEVRRGVFGYDAVGVTAPVDLTVGAGEVVALLGPSGCGKTTILKTLAGALSPVHGEILVDEAARTAEWLASRVSRTLQSFPLFHWLTVEENLKLAGRVRGIDVIDVAKVLSDFSAQHLASRYPLTLSGGERCRASLAQAALSRPRALLLDEPFAGLDLRVKADIARHVFSFSRTEAVPVVLVTHDLLDAFDHADRIVVMAKNGGPSHVVDVVEASAPGAFEQVRQHLLGDQRVAS